MRTAVTGGAGFIGSHLVDALVERGDEVTVFDDLSSGKREYLNERATFVERDIRDGIELDGMEVVFHLAAQADVQTSVAEPAFDAEVNVVGTVRVVEAARAAGARVIFSSTGGAIYGEVAEPATEEAERRPIAPYGIAKLCAEEYLFGWNRIHGSQHVVLRFGNVFGPRQSPTLEGGVVSIFLDRFARGETTTIYGDGLQERDFVYVGDVAGALVAAASSDGAGVFNVGSGSTTSVLDLNRACAEVAGVTTAPVFAGVRLGDARRSALDVSRIAADLGWRAQTSLSDGLRATWAWVAEESAGA